MTPGPHGIRTTDHRHGPKQRCTVLSTPAHVHFLQHEQASAKVPWRCQLTRGVLPTCKWGISQLLSPYIHRTCTISRTRILIRARTPTEKTPARHDDPRTALRVVSVHENPFIMQTRWAWKIRLHQHQVATWGVILIANLCSMTIHFGLCKSFCAAEGLVLLENLISLGA